MEGLLKGGLPVTTAMTTIIICTSRMNWKAPLNGSTVSKEYAKTFVVRTIIPIRNAAVNALEIKNMLDHAKLKHPIFY